jgi:hypothetical protein
MVLAPAPVAAAPQRAVWSGSIWFSDLIVISYGRTTRTRVPDRSAPTRPAYQPTLKRGEGDLYDIGAHHYHPARDQALSATGPRAQREQERSTAPWNWQHSTRVERRIVSSMRRGSSESNAVKKGQYTNDGRGDGNSRARDGPPGPLGARAKAFGPGDRARNPGGVRWCRITFARKSHRPN